jgi:hypothetical protein
MPLVAAVLDATHASKFSLPKELSSEAAAIARSTFSFTAAAPFAVTASNCSVAWSTVDLIVRAPFAAFVVAIFFSSGTGLARQIWVAACAQRARFWRLLTP